MAAIGVAILSYRWFEKLLIDAARRWGRPVRPGAQASP
jgi:peptidoglycan/LPS O-acetylase OafA/YrhL